MAMHNLNLNLTVPTPPSPSTSYYDVSDAEEGEYNTITHNASAKGVKLLFSKSKVYVHPTPSAKDNIPGFIALVQQRSTPFTTDQRPPSSDPNSKNPSKNNASSYLLAWVPESTLSKDDMNTYVKVDMIDNETSPKQSYLVPPLPVASTYDDSNVGPYAFSLPLSSIYSILVRPPSIGWWFGSIVINTKSGSSLPALFFHDSECQSTILQRRKRTAESFNPFGEGGNLYWGGDEIVKWLKKYVTVERSTAEPSVFLINPSDEDKIGFGQGRKSLEPPSLDRRVSQSQVPKKIEPPKDDFPEMEPLVKALKETRWKVLNSFSKITNFAKRATQDIANNNNVPPQMRKMIHNPEVQNIQDDFDSARIYLARWAMGIAEQSERERNQRIWTAKDIMEMEQSTVGDFEILDMEAGRMTIAESKRKPVDMQEWKSFFDAKGRLQVTQDEVKERIFHGGLDPEDGVRKEAWLFLLGVYDWNTTDEERHAFMNAKRDEYIRLKGAWWDRMIEGQSDSEQEEWWKEQKHRIEKDVHRTDRNIPLYAGEDIPHPDPTSPFYNPNGPGTNVHLEQLKDMLLTYIEYDTPEPQPSPQANGAGRPRQHSVSPLASNLGYVQGMSDLLSPLYAVFQDDAVAFWAFVAFMQRMSRNFARSQVGMRAQLSTLDQMCQVLDPKLYMHLQHAESTNFFFFFRMIIVWYKREFAWPDVLRLWESLWTDYLSSQFHLFISMAILEKHKEVIIEHLRHFDEVLKYFNELSGTIDLPSTLTRAEGLFRRFEKTVEAIDRKEHFPLPTEMRVSSDDLRRKDEWDEKDPSSVTVSTADSDSEIANIRSRRVSDVSSRRDSRRPSAAPTPPLTVLAVVPKGRIITPELRGLLSRKIVTIDKDAEMTAARTRASGLRD